MPRFPKPAYNYEFINSGLGAVEPLYPMYQKGQQGGYSQLIPAFFFNSRHIDHRSSLETPEGCRVDSAYLLRNLSEYPETMFANERAEGYTRLVVRLEHYTRLRPDAECGRHVAHDPDPDFDPMQFMWSHRGAMTLADFPQEELHRFEAKLSVNFPIIEERGHERTPFNLRDLQRNSLWFYPDGHPFDYGIDAPRPQPSLASFRLPRQAVVEATPGLQEAYPLPALLPAHEFRKVLDFMNGRPLAGFDAASEPGNDTLRLADVTEKNIYTSGLHLEPIKDVVADVSNMRHFRLVGMTIKPQEAQLDGDWSGERIVPQIRFVYQLTNPRSPEHVFEQLFLHLKWDVVDRLADEPTRAEQLRAFMNEVDRLTQARDSGGWRCRTPHLHRGVHESPSGARGRRSASSLTGTWIFGNLERDNATGEFRRSAQFGQGIDYGFYSSVYDNDLLRAEIGKASGKRKAELEAVLESLTVATFRDPKRQDVHALRFNSVSCAQCHQMSGRDGVHMSINDGINSKVTSPTIVSEYFFHEIDAQLKGDVQVGLVGK